MHYMLHDTWFLKQMGISIKSGPYIATNLQVLEDAIHSTLLLPAEQSSTEFAASQKITTPLTLAILSGINNYSNEIYCDQISARSEVRSMKREVY